MGLIDFPTLNASKKYTEDSLKGAGALLGIGISKVDIDANAHLIVTYDKALPDGSTQRDAGALPTGGSYVQTISTPLQTWSIQHNLNTSWNELLVITTDDNSDYIIGEVDHTNSTNNLLVIKFDKPFAGKAVVKK